MADPIVGTNGADLFNTFNGTTNGADEIWGLGGDDTIFAAGGNDLIKGGGGADNMDGETGVDTATYEDSTAGVSVSLTTGNGSGGYAEGDHLTHIENLIGSNYADYLYGDAGANTLSGLDGNDILDGDAGNDGLYGGNGNDTLKGGGGADTLNGGAGIDTASYIASYTGVVVSLATGLGAYGHADGDVLTGIENLTGSAYADSLFGNASDNVLIGFDGNDQLNGNAGQDTLLGGDGNDVLDGGSNIDTMDGGLGNDWFFVDNAADVVIEASFEGNDRVFASASYTLAPGVWVETLSTNDNFGVAPINLTGNGVGNIIYGNAGSNILNGMGGADTMIGFGGNDFYFVDNVLDSVTESIGGGTDRVFASTSYALAEGANKEIEIVSTADNFGLAAIHLTGNSFANSVFGNAGNNVLDGGAGNDTLAGLGGSDMFVFSSALNAATNVDVIADFSAVDDAIGLDDAIFTALAPGALAASAFTIGAAAADASDRIIYNSATGALLYDADGVGGAAAIQFATLNPGLAVTNADFVVM